MLNSFPILRRELWLAARRTSTYRHRTLLAALALGLVATMMLFSNLTRLNGVFIFNAISWFGLVLAAFEGLRTTADSISLERREGTLGLLLLTAQQGRQVVLGKFAAATVQSLPVVLSLLPAFALPLLLGGVSGAECGRVMLTFVVTLLFTLSVGIFVSSLVVNPLAAFAAAYGLVFVVIIPPVAFTRLTGAGGMEWIAWLGGPLEMFLRSPDSRYDRFFFGLALIVSLILSALLFWATCVQIQRNPRLELNQSGTGWRRWLRPKVGWPEGWGGASAQTSPAVWLAERTLPGRRALWTLLTLGLLACFLIGWLAGRDGIFGILFCQAFFAYLIKLWLAAVAPQSFNESRRSGALELLLCSPLSAGDLLRGQVDALYSYFIGPALTLAVGFTMAGLGGIGLWGALHPASQMPDASPLAYSFLWFVVFVLDMHALIYLGLWLGLTTARVDRAIAKTVFGVLLLPWLTMIVPFLGCLGLIAWPIFWISWASRRLRERIRDEATKSFAAEAEASGWLPWAKARTFPAGGDASKG